MKQASGSPTTSCCEYRWGALHGTFASCRADSVRTEPRTASSEWSALMTGPACALTEAGCIAFADRTGIAAAAMKRPETTVTAVFLSVPITLSPLGAPLLGAPQWTRRYSRANDWFREAGPSVQTN